MPFVKDLSYEEFWREKEKKHGAGFVYSTMARYLFRYPESLEETDGLLYFSESVVCFENFKNTNFFYNMLIREEFKKILVEIPMNSIVGVTSGNKENREERGGCFKRLLKSLNAPENLLLIDTKKENNERVYAFSLSEKPQNFCGKIATFLRNP